MRKSSEHNLLLGSPCRQPPSLLLNSLGIILTSLLRSLDMVSISDRTQDFWIQQRSKLSLQTSPNSASQLYAIITGGILGLVILTRLVLRMTRGLKDHILIIFLQHVLYPFLIKRHRLLGPWSRASLLFQAMYLSTTILCLSYKVSDLSEAGIRAGTLSLINIIPLFSGLHLSSGGHVRDFGSNLRQASRLNWRHGWGLGVLPRGSRPREHEHFYTTLRVTTVWAYCKTSQ